MSGIGLWNVVQDTRTLMVQVSGFADAKLPYHKNLTIRPETVEFTYTTDAQWGPFVLTHIEISGHRVLKSGNLSGTSFHKESWYTGSKVGRPDGVEEIEALALELLPVKSQVSA